VILPVPGDLDVTELIGGAPIGAQIVMRRGYPARLFDLCAGDPHDAQGDW
jgi:hypothetical protein